MDAHEAHVDWKFLEKLCLNKCPRSININKIPHYWIIMAFMLDTMSQKFCSYH
jgi:hypothetical protein